MKLIQLGISKVVERVFRREKGKGMEVAIIAGNLGIGPGNPSNPKGGGEGNGFGKSWQGPSQFWLKVVCLVKVVKVMVKVLGTKVRVSTANKLDIKQPSARMHELLRCLRFGQKSRLVVWR